MGYTQADATKLLPRTHRTDRRGTTLQRRNDIAELAAPGHTPGQRAPRSPGSRPYRAPATACSRQIQTAPPRLRPAPRIAPGQHGGARTPGMQAACILSYCLPAEVAPPFAAALNPPTPPHPHPLPGIFAVPALLIAAFGQDGSRHPWHTSPHAASSTASQS
jgi:hypothetical protein